MVDKKCGECGEKKMLSEFFASPYDSAAHDVRTSAYCKQCHAEGRIKYGYGWYGDKYKTPGDTGYSALAE